MVFALPLLFTLAAQTEHPLAAAERALAEGKADVAIAALSKPEPLLEDYRAFYLGSAHLLRGDRTAAEQWLKKITKKPAFEADCKPACNHPLWEEAADLLSTAIETRSATAAAALLLELPATGQRLERAATLWRKAGKEDRARDAELRLLLEAPESVEGKKLAEKLGEKGVAERLVTHEKRLERVRKLLDTHENEAARLEARGLIADKSSAECELRYIEGKASRKLRDYNAALEAFPKAREVCAASKQTGKLLASTLLEIQVRSIKGQLSRVRRLAQGILKNHPDHSYADDALMALALLEERRGDVEKARAAYETILTKYEKGDQTGEAGWWLGFEAIRRDDKEAAKRALDRVANGAWSDPMDEARVRYWLARIEKDSKAACEKFREAVTLPGLTFYSWLSLSHLRRTDKECGKKIEAELVARAGQKPDGVKVPKKMASSVAFKRALALLASGLDDRAAGELALLEHDKLDKNSAIALAIRYDQVGAHFEAQTLLRRHGHEALRSLPDKSTREIWEAAYSRPFEREIASASKESKLDPLLLTALSREESTFDPAIVSWAGAVGLAQLMPATAIGAYADLKLGRLDLAQLLDPALNLRLGARVLRDGLNQFDEEVPLALAAYNGGAELTKKTLPSSGERPFDLWVESIPVRETRRYVQRVSGTWGIYRFLYDASRPFIDLPEKVAAP